MRVRVFASVAIEQTYKYLRPEGGSVGFGWQIQDLNVEGACGDARDADAARGKLIVEDAATRFIELLREIDSYPLDSLRDH